MSQTEVTYRANTGRQKLAAWATCVRCGQGLVDIPDYVARVHTGRVGGTPSFSAFYYHRSCWEAERREREATGPVLIGPV